MEEFIREKIIDKITGKSVPGGVGLDGFDDGAVIPLGDLKLVVSTDAHTVSPLFFPGGDIGSLSVYGTLNDLAVMGANPVALTLTLVVEEGYPIKDLERIMKSVDKALESQGVKLVAGDTKVMERGKVDGVVTSTTGFGVAEKVVLNSGLKPGDKIIVSGCVGDHGIALLSSREGIEFKTKLESDCGPVWPFVEKALRVGGINAMKDPTRGGLAMALNEIASASKVGIEVSEEDIPVKDEVQSACEMLGLDPYTIACEGRVVFGVESELAGEVVDALHKAGCGDAAVIGEVTTEHPGRVILNSLVGGRRFMDPPEGELIPRIC